MERQTYNRKILSLLLDNCTEERLRICDVKCSVEDFQQYVSEINDYIESNPQLRWCQIIWIMDLNFNPHGPRDRFNEESIMTLRKLISNDQLN